MYVYVAAVVAAPAYWAVRWRQPMECDLVYILEVVHTTVTTQPTTFGERSLKWLLVKIELCS